MIDITTALTILIVMLMVAGGLGILTFLLKMITEIEKYKPPYLR